MQAAKSESTCFFSNMIFGLCFLQSLSHLGCFQVLLVSLWNMSKYSLFSLSRFTQLLVISHPNCSVFQVLTLFPNIKLASPNPFKMLLSKLPFCFMTFIMMNHVLPHLLLQQEKAFSLTSSSDVWSNWDTLQTFF